MDRNNIVDTPIHQENSDYHFVEGSYFSIQFKILAFTLFLKALHSLYEQSYVSFLILTLIAVVIFIAKKGITISPSLQQYRYFFGLLKFKLGKWQTLPEFESISIFRARKSQTSTIATQSSTAYFSEIEVNLIYNTSRKLTVFISDKYDAALEKARYFESLFKLPIYDATEREGKWI